MSKRIRDNFDIRIKEPIDIRFTGDNVNVTTPYEGLIKFQNSDKRFYGFVDGVFKDLFRSDLYVNVKYFGAKGDGTTDDTQAFNNAISYQQSNGGVLLIPYGTYIINSPLIFSSTVHILGVNMPTLKLKTGFTGANASLIYLNNVNNVSIINIKIDGNRSNITQPFGGILGFKCNYTKIENVDVINSAGIGIGFSNSKYTTLRYCRVTYTGNSKPGIWFDADLGGEYLNSYTVIDNCEASFSDLDGFLINVNNIKIINCIGNNNGVFPNNGALGAAGLYSDTERKNVIVENCTFSNNTEYGISMPMNFSSISNCICDSNYLSGITLRTNSNNVNIKGCICTTNGVSDTTANPTFWTKDGITIDACSFIIITNCITVGNKKYGIAHTNTASSNGIIVTSNNLKYNTTDDANIGASYPSQNITNLIYTNNY